MFTLGFWLKWRWFLFSAFSLTISFIYTAIFSTGILQHPMWRIEQWLLRRPITRGDCVLAQWARIGDADVMILLALSVGCVCIILGYRKRVLFYMLLILLVGIIFEVVGKQIFPQQMPQVVQRSLDALQCPSMYGESRHQDYLVSLGIWWAAPPVSQDTILLAHMGAVASLTNNQEMAVIYGYPSGHAIRWMFLGLVTCWLSLEHVRSRLLRRILVILTCVIAFGGGFAQFYIGNHYSTDLVIGYLLGISSACCMIGLLIRNRRSRPTLTSIDAGEHRYVSFSDRR